MNEVKGYSLEDQERSIPSSGAWEQYDMFKNFKGSVAQQSKKESRGDRGHRLHSAYGPCKGFGFIE